MELLLNVEFGELGELFLLRCVSVEREDNRCRGVYVIFEGEVEEVRAVQAAIVDGLVCAIPARSESISGV